MAEDFSDMFSKENPGLILGVCGNCEKEQGIDQKAYQKQGWSASHGICARHAEKFLKAANIPDDRIKKVVSNNTTRDLADPKNKPVVDWLKNPPPAPSKNQSGLEKAA